MGLGINSGFGYGNYGYGSYGLGAWGGNATLGNLAQAPSANPYAQLWDFGTTYQRGASNGALGAQNPYAQNPYAQNLGQLDPQQLTAMLLELVLAVAIMQALQGGRDLGALGGGSSGGKPVSWGGGGGSGGASAGGGGAGGTGGTGGAGGGSPTAGGTASVPANTPTGRGTSGDFLQAALAQNGDRYVYGAETNLNDKNPNTFDCSELVQWAAHQAGVTIPDGSGNQAAYCRQHGKQLSVEEAIRTPGALLFKEGHVAISLGDGRTIEAMGSNYGVRIGNARGRFTSGGLIPGMSYS